MCDSTLTLRLIYKATGVFSTSMLCVCATVPPQIDLLVADRLD
jgi:hypothetical protein